MKWVSKPQFWAALSWAALQQIKPPKHKLARRHPQRTRNYKLREKLTRFSNVFKKKALSVNNLFLTLAQRRLIDWLRLINRVQTHHNFFRWILAMAFDWPKDKKRLSEAPQRVGV